MLHKKPPEANTPEIAAMADPSGGGGRRRGKSSILNLSLFAGFAAPAGPRSPRSFADGAVGLGIVAAIAGGDGAGLAAARAAAAMGRSEPIPIAGKAPPPAAWGPTPTKPGEAELSESYTCVISHVGGGSVKERVYFGEDVVFFDCPPPPEPPAVEAAAMVPSPPMGFLSRCYLCRKKLDGLDIYMYRGDRAFCSAECRCQQMLMDEHRESCGSGALKSYEISVSPCSDSLLFATGIAAA